MRYVIALLVTKINGQPVGYDYATEIADVPTINRPTPDLSEMVPADKPYPLGNPSKNRMKYYIIEPNQCRMVCQ